MEFVECARKGLKTPPLNLKELSFLNGIFPPIRLV
jgi:hypothetical protein